MTDTKQKEVTGWIDTNINPHICIVCKDEISTKLIRCNGCSTEVHDGCMKERFGDGFGEERKFVCPDCGASFFTIEEIS